MPASHHGPQDTPALTTAEELARIPYEPLLPVEKKLIAGSLLLGLVLLALLVWLSNTFFASPLPTP